MLNTIRTMIKEKESFLEAADVIFEDGSGKNLDNFIVLGEEGEDPIPETDITENDDENDVPTDDGDEKEKEEGEDDGNGSSEDDDVSNLPIDDEPVAPTAPVDPASNDDVLNSPADGSDIGNEQPMPLPGNDLPTPVGAQTGEPINDDDDIMNVEIDLGSNTVKDVLPVPPANAGEAIADSEGPQHVDSGFAGEGGTEAVPQSAEFSEKKEDKEKEDDKEEFKESGNSMSSMLNSFFGSSYTEAITLGDDPAPKEDAAPAEDPAAEEPAAEESEVTSAVRDKVAEVESDAPASDSGGTASKEDLLKKLGNITKSLEDAKKAVMNTLQ